MQAAITLVFYKGLSENQGRVAGDESQISDKQTAVYHQWPASNETPALDCKQSLFCCKIVETSVQNGWHCRLQIPQELF